MGQVGQWDTPLIKGFENSIGKKTGGTGGTVKHGLMVLKHGLKIWSFCIYKVFFLYTIRRDKD